MSIIYCQCVTHSWGHFICQFRNRHLTFFVNQVLSVLCLTPFDLMSNMKWVHHDSLCLSEMFLRRHADISAWNSMIIKHRPPPHAGNCQSQLSQTIHWFIIARLFPFNHLFPLLWWRTVALISHVWKWNNSDHFLFCRNLAKFIKNWQLVNI